MQDIKRITAKFSNQLKRGKNEPDFFYLLRLIENIREDLPKIGEAKSPDFEAVRFGQTPYLSFPETTISSIQESHRHKEDLSILVYFMGLLGPNGPLPLEMTSYIYQRSIHEYDLSTKRFLDIINHRFISLFYRAFSKNEISVNFDRKQSELEKLYQTLTGVGFFSKNKLPSYSALSLLRYLICKDKSSDGLEKALMLFFDMPLRVVPFLQKQHQIPKEYLLHLGDKETSLLGINTQIGNHYFTKTKDISIVVGPISFKDSFAFMPRQTAFVQLCEIIKLYLDKPIDFDLVLEIDSSTIEGAVLNGNFALGQSTHIRSVQSTQSVTIVRINVSSIVKHQNAL